MNPPKEGHDDRRQRLLACALPQLLRTGSVGFDDIQAVYPGKQASLKKRRDRFSHDCKAIVRLIKRVQIIYSPLAPYLPALTFSKGKLLCSPRRFSQLLRSPHLDRRKALAKALLDAQTDGGIDLVPRNGTIFLGYGTTTYCISLEMITRQEFDNVHIYTGNIEIAILFYLSAPGQFARNQVHFFLPGCQLDWNTGSMTLADPEFGTAIISFEYVDSQGVIYADTEPKCEMTNQAVKRARDRVIVVADHSKMKQGTGGLPIALPTEREIYLCLEEKPPLDFQFPPGVIAKPLL